MTAKRRCPSEAALCAYVEELLNERERAEVRAHLGDCAQCREILAELSELRRSVTAAGGGARRAWIPASGRPIERRGADCPAPELLAAYADGSLPAREERRIESHLARCVPCLAEVADLMSLACAPAREGPERAVERVLDRLQDERKSAVVRLAERSIRVMRDFGGVVPSGARGAPLGTAEPAFATAREAVAPARLRWSDDRIEVECEIRGSAREAALTGRVIAGGAPAWAASVTLEAGGALRGPESPDRRGRFGPWPLAIGSNRLAIAIGGGDETAVELSIEVEEEEGGPDRGGCPEAGARD